MHGPILSSARTDEAMASDTPAATLKEAEPPERCVDDS